MFHAVNQRGNAILMVMASMAALSYVYINMTASLKEADKFVNSKVVRLQKFRLLDKISNELSNEKTCAKTFSKVILNSPKKNITLLNLFSKPFFGQKFSSVNTPKIVMIENNFIHKDYNEITKTSFPELQMRLVLNKRQEIIEIVPLIAKWDSQGELLWCSVYSRTDYLALKKTFCKDGANCNFKNTRFQESPSKCFHGHGLSFQNVDGINYCL